MEEEATNAKASEWLVPSSALADFVVQTAPFFGETQIVGFAEAVDHHPGIVLGRLMCEGHVKYSHMRRLLVKVSPLLGAQIDA